MSSTRLLTCLGVLLVGALPLRAGSLDGRQRQADALALAARIDHLLEKSWAAHHVIPAPPLEDGAFLRRIYLHLAGRIPSVYEVRRFLDDPAADKRRAEIERLLAGHRFPLHLANVWRALLLPEASAGAESRFFGPPLEAWLRARFAADVGYDKMVRELLMAETARGPANRLLLDIQGMDPGDGLSPQAFYQAKQYKPENLAEATARTFLGVRLGCAQCHNHPFAQWKREQFWEYAAFFAGVRGSARPDGTADQPAPRELKIADTGKVAQAKFLDGRVPVWKEKDNPRAVLADWMTTKDNPYFARAAVNRLWAYFFGVGLVEPVDEMVGTEAVPSQPELLDELARDFAAHDFDLRYMILAITSSKAYQLSSARTHSSQDDPRQFARAPLLGMTPEQLFDSVTEATRSGINRAAQPGFINVGQPGRDEFLTKFSNLSDRPTEYQTSIIQALSLMNGRLTADATSLERSEFLASVLDSPFLETKQRIETLYLGTLTRLPREKEMKRALVFIETALQHDDKTLSAEARDKRYQQALADLFWALLNSGEFFFNH